MTLRDRLVVTIDDGRKLVEPILPENVIRWLRYPYTAFTESLSRGTKTVSLDGLEAMFISSNPKTRRLPDVANEERILRDIASELQRDDVFFDIGANVGLYSCLLGSQLTNGEVVAFEPHPGNAERLRENIHLNAMESTIYEMALSDESGRFDLVVNDARTGSTHNTLVGSEVSIDSKRDQVGGEIVTVETNTLDSLRGTGDVPQPTVVKIDVEGAEYDVIRGAEATFSKPNCRLVYCECHPRHLPEFGAALDDVTALLGEYGFEIDVLLDRRSEVSPDGVVFLKARRPES